MSTLRFAENVGTLKNNPKINVIMNEITMARRKTPTKQMFTPRPTSTFKANQTALNNLSKKKLNFPPTNTSTARKKGLSINPNNTTARQQPYSFLAPHDVPPARPTEHDFSFAGNISTSTFINQPIAALDQTQNFTGSYSPVIRQCMSTFESKMEERINAAVNDIANKFMVNSSMLGATFEQPQEEQKRNLKRQSKVAMPEMSKRRSTRNSHLLVLDDNKPQGGNEDVKPMEDTFDMLDETMQMMGLEQTLAVAETSMLRRSRRVQDLNESRALQRKEEVTMAKNMEVVVKDKKKRQKNPSFLKNRYLTSFFRLSTQFEAPQEEVEEAKTETTSKSAPRKGKKTTDPKKTHAKEVLNILNNGNLKELQILPQIGLKTAYQIMTFR